VRSRTVVYALPSVFAFLLAASALSAAATPHVYWASDPVRPDETVLAEGQDFEGAEVEMARLDDEPAAEPGCSVEIKQWTTVPVLQGDAGTLKFSVPGDWRPGVFAFRVKGRQGISESTLLNAPDVWWVQGDEGAAATPGGWLGVFGKSLHFGSPSIVRLQPEQGPPVTLTPASADCYALRFTLPEDLKPGRYTIHVHHGLGGPAAWRSAGTIAVEPKPNWPADVFSVLELYGPDAAVEMRKTLIKYAPIPDRSEGVQAALKKAKENGGGVVYFPAGRYGISGTLDVPPRTVLRGEGTGLVVLWWGAGRFNLDGGGQQGLARDGKQASPPANLIYGRQFGIEDMSLYFPLDHQTAISGGDRFRMRRVRVRVDHLWTIDGSRRPEGTVARLGDNAQVTDCDIIAKGTALIPGRYALIARNQILAGKTHCPMGGAEEVIVEDNRLVSTYPTAYQNISGVGRNLYFGRNRQESLQTHQADFSFTFDAGCAAYYGTLASLEGTRLTLAADPSYPPWAAEKSDLWKKAVVCVLDGRGARQWREVVSNQGRQWELERPFDYPPDTSSILTIIPFNGRVLAVGNRFEDANWVNAGYGTSLDVICAENQLYRCAQLLNYGLDAHGHFQPCWHVQYLDNEAHEGHTTLDTTGSIRTGPAYTGPITRSTIRRRDVIDADNSGGIGVSGRTRDVIVEGCVLKHPMNLIRVDADAQGVLLRNNRFEAQAAPHYEGSSLSSAKIVPQPSPNAR
jgi:hypothetical protein